MYFAKELVETLRATRFSIIQDGTIDVSSEKQLRICVMYVNEADFTPVTRFFDMVSVQDKGAEGIYKAIKNAFEEKKIPLGNIIGFSSDT